MEISVKNHADALIFHTTICAAGATNCDLKKTDMDFSNLAEPNRTFGSPTSDAKASAE